MHFFLKIVTLGTKSVTSVNHGKSCLLLTTCCFFLLFILENMSVKLLKYFMSTEGCQFQNQHVNSHTKFFYVTSNMFYKENIDSF